MIERAIKKEINQNLVAVRTASFGDLDGVVELENKMWSADQRCSPDHFVRRFQEPHGYFILAESIERQVVGTFFCIKKTYLPLSKSFNWYGEGCEVGKGPDVHGNALFGVSVTVSDLAPKGTLRALFNGWRDLARTNKLSYIYGGSRIPGLHSFAGSAEQYLEQILRGKIFDPVLSKYILCGLKVGNLIPNYFEDPESLNYGVEVYDSF